MSDLEIVTEARRHKEVCFCCRLIIEDWDTNKKLTDFPYDYNNKGDFPRASKEKHAKLEKGITI